MPELLTITYDAEQKDEHDLVYEIQNRLFAAGILSVTARVRFDEHGDYGDYPVIEGEQIYVDGTQVRQLGAVGVVSYLEAVAKAS